MGIIKPIFGDLANYELLGECSMGKTQISNESVNSVIWAREPNIVFASVALKLKELAIDMARNSKEYQRDSLF
ncbi:hypothetical protein CEXT_150731 [Caerostris extrusa]|uniref:Uncharacterized protein n=1 Tax=Caerostris extrusa TaxID=172846 RepID=A0AAV4MP00_CAEEX|nr:hypothetical protein CEXT_150731 [Caerostris extrusa]